MQLGLTEEQQALRRRGIGGSDVAALLGLDPYRTPFDVWMAKTGRSDPAAGENRFTRWGHRLEEAIAAEYAEQLDVTLERSPTIVHRERPWQVGTPDRLVMRAPFPVGAADWGLECKARGIAQRHRWGETGSAEIPDEVATQAHWYMSLTGLPRWDVAVLIAGNDFRRYELHHDADVEAALLDVGARFWRDHVEADKPPALDGSDAAWRFLRERLRSATPKVVEPTPAIDAIAADLERARDARERAEQMEAVCKQQLADLAAGLGVQGFACEAWRFRVYEQSGRVNYKKLAEELARRLDLTDAQRLELSQQFITSPSIASRFTSARDARERAEQLEAVCKQQLADRAAAGAADKED